MARALLLAAALAALALAGCGGRAPPASDDAIQGKVTVFAAASLTEAFTEIAVAFEERYPGADVVFSFGGTPTLRAQLEQGARADVFASADADQMQLALKARLLAASPGTFARNFLVIITPKGNPARIEGPADLAGPGLKLVLANRDVPAGLYTNRALDNLGRAYGPDFASRVLRNVVSQESNVKQVVAKVELGEADAGIVYASDVTEAVAARLSTIAISPEFNVSAEYQIAAVRGAGNPAAAAAFIDFVLSPQGQKVLEGHGFTSI